MKAICPLFLMVAVLVVTGCGKKGWDGAISDAKKGMNAAPNDFAKANFGKLVKQLEDIKNGGDVNAKEPEFGASALMLAASFDQTEAVQLLIEKGADVNSTDSKGWTVLMSIGNNEKVARLLIEKGADVNARNEDGDTALIEHAYRGREAVVRLLVEKGADIHAKNKNGWTPLISAKATGQMKVAKILTDAGARE